MSVIKGPFTIKWGDTQIDDIESIDIDYEKITEDYESNLGKVFVIDKAEKITVSITLLATDIASLSLLLPQYFIGFGQDLSTGEEVVYPDGAIDFLLSECDTEVIYNNLEIIACGPLPQTLRIVDTRTQLGGIYVDNKLQKVTVNFIGESGVGRAPIQFFNIQPVDESILLLESGEIFLLDDGDTVNIL